MRISTRWLSDWLASVPEPKALAQRLTMAGLEIEGVEPAAPPLTGVVVGEIVECGRHPNADTLSLCIVDAGTERVQVVCGAPNARVGLLAPLARVGAVLPGAVEIRAATLRGVESHGMLCSPRELGLGEDGGGLLELPAGLRPGASLSEAMSLDDTVLEVNLTPNRGDCMSVLGIAREVAVLQGSNLTGPACRPVIPTIDDSFAVELSPGAGCVRFASRVIRGIDPSVAAPLWLRERLRRAGLRSIGAAVDVTNYVMLELGQPMHAYDLAGLDRAVVVRRARRGEALTLLDGRVADLDEQVLVIADRSRLLGLAGVMGGEGSGIGPTTCDVLLEVAFFLPEVIAGRGRRYGLVTDASQRFERGVDPTLQERAIERATELLLACAGGAAGPVRMDELVDELPAQRRVDFRWARAQRVIGAEVPPEAMRGLLQGLGMTVVGDGPSVQVLPPPWRFDIAIEEDLIEEVARLHGFDNIPESDGLAPLSMPALAESRADVEAVSDRLVQRGFHEAITYSFVDAALQSTLFPGAEALTLSNPISADLAAMRVSLWPGLLRACVDNQRRQQPRVRLFEVGRKFVGSGADLSEVAVVAGVAGGPALPLQWGVPERAIDFFDLKSDVEALLRASGAPEQFLFEAAEHPALQPGQTARILREGRPVGWLGRVHPQAARAIDLTYSVLLFELELEAGLAARLPQHREVSRFPSVRRDLAIVVDETVSVQSVCDCIRSSAGPMLTELVVFDLYRGQGIEPGRKSIATGLILQDVCRTLADDDIDAVVAAVVADLQRECNATIRDK